MSLSYSLIYFLLSQGLYFENKITNYDKFNYWFNIFNFSWMHQTRPIRRYSRFRCHNRIDANILNFLSIFRKGFVHPEQFSVLFPSTNFKIWKDDILVNCTYPYHWNGVFVWEYSSIKQTCRVVILKGLQLSFLVCFSL